MSIFGDLKWIREIAKQAKDVAKELEVISLKR